MRTTDDLRAVFADIESAAPTALRNPGKVLAPSHRRYRLIAAAAVAVIVVGIAVGLAVTRRGNTTSPAHPHPSHSQCNRNAHCPVLDEHGNPMPAPTHYTLSVASDEATPIARELTPREETLTLDSRTAGLASVRSYAADFVPTATVTGARANVPGHPDAHYAHDVDDARKYIVWTENGRTIVVRAKSHVLLELARAVQVGSYPIALPFRFGRLPSGLVPESIKIGLDKASPGGIFAKVGFTDGAHTQQSDNFYVGSAAIAVATGVEPGLDGAHQTGTTTDGHGIYVGGKQPWGEATTVQVALTAHNAAILLPNPARLNTYSAADLTNIASRMTFSSNPKDPATWFTTNLFPN
jgi:hypothetical protein